MYVDAGPFKPLHLSRLNATAENIRNIRSKDRVYPSEVHLEGVVFDAGRLSLDGRADFLAEPHPGVLAAVRLDQIELDYFKPVWILRSRTSATSGSKAPPSRGFAAGSWAAARLRRRSPSCHGRVGRIWISRCGSRVPTWQA